MLIQLPFHKDKDFKQLHFFIQMFIVSKVYIAGWVEYLDYQSQSEVPVVQCNKNSNTNKSKQETRHVTNT